MKADFVSNLEGALYTLCRFGKKDIENALLKKTCNFTLHPRYPNARLFWGRRFALVFLGDGVIGKDIVAAFALLQEQNSPPPPIGIV